MPNRVALVACLGMVGCGGSGPEAGVAEPTSGAEVAAAREPAPRVEDEPAPEPVARPVRGPGRLRVVNMVGGRDAGGTIQILDGSGRVVLEGRSGETYSLDAGTYRVVGTVTDRTALVDTPTREEEDPVTVAAGREEVVRVAHPVARVRLAVTQRGRPVASWRAELRRTTGQGGVLELQPSETHTPVSPGRYDAVVHVGGQRFTVTGVIFQGGATMDVPVTIE